jgi:hypothetical protein
MDLLSPAKFNVWYSQLEMGYSFVLMCAGLQIRNPEARLTKSSLWIKTNIKKDAIYHKEYCDSDQDELFRIHPRMMVNDPGNDRIKLLNQLDEIRSQPEQLYWFR